MRTAGQLHANRGKTTQLCFWVLVNQLVTAGILQRHDVHTSDSVPLRTVGGCKTGPHPMTEIAPIVPEPRVKL